MLSSSNYIKQPGVLQSGNQFSSAVDPAVLRDPKTKIYKHPAHGSRFIMPDGAEIIFLGGVFITNNPDIIAELDKVANKRGTQITTDEAGLARLQAEITQAAEDAARPASEGNVAGNQTIGLQQNPELQQAVNASNTAAKPPVL